MAETEQGFRDLARANAPWMLSDADAQRLALADEIARAAVWEARGFPQLVDHGSWIWQWPIPYWQCVAFAKGMLAARQQAPR